MASYTFQFNVLARSGLPKIMSMLYAASNICLVAGAENVILTYTEAFVIKKTLYYKTA